MSLLADSNRLRRAAIDPKQISPRSRKRLKQALSIVMGTEALIAVRDISRASIEESLDTAAWAARALVRQALTEEEQARRKRDTLQTNSRSSPP